ncbi:unknown [Bacteroides sp. CAG:770]|nr:unknown [Bacteroides sp. CAG:770]
MAVSLSSRKGMTIPDSSTTAIFLDSSLAITIMIDGREHNTAKSIGTRKVVIRNDFFFTRVRYSRLMMIFTICRFMVKLLLLLV